MYSCLSGKFLVTRLSGKFYTVLSFIWNCLVILVYLENFSDTFIRKILHLHSFIRKMLVTLINPENFTHSFIRRFLLSFIRKILVTLVYPENFTLTLILSGNFLSNVVHIGKHFSIPSLIHKFLIIFCINFLVILPKFFPKFQRHSKILESQP